MRILVTIVLEDGEVDSSTIAVLENETPDSATRRSIKGMAHGKKVISASASVFQAHTLTIQPFGGQ